MPASRDRSSQSLPSADPPSFAPISKILTRPPRKAHPETPSFILMKEAFMSNSQIYTDSQHDPSIDRIALEDSLSIRQDEPGNETMGISRPERPFMQSFRFWSIMAFTSTVMCTWEIALGTAAIPLAAGGTAGFVWTYIATSIAMTIVIASLAEIASIAPAGGGVYHWVGRFAPLPARGLLSYLVGWTSILAWQAGAAALNLLAATLVQALVALWHPAYAARRWHASLLTVGFGLLSTGANTYGVKTLPVLELVMLVLHFFGILVVLVPLWARAPKASAASVFRGFEDYGGWGNVGLACLIGQIGPVFAFSRADGAIHISEKMRNASRVIPCSMAGSAILNGLLGLAAVLTFAFSIQSTHDLLASPTGHPFIAGFYAATGSQGLTTAATVVVILLLFGAGLSVLATASRHVVRFSRDDGLPLPNLWTAVVVRIGSDEAPLNAFLVCFAATVVLALLHLAIDAALDLSVSLFVSALLFTYFVAILCALLHRRRGDQPAERLWTLGRLSVPASAFALAYITLVFAMSFFPVSRSGLVPATMNWNPVVWTAAVLFATLLYALHGRYVFKGPSRMFSLPFEDPASYRPASYRPTYGD